MSKSPTQWGPGEDKVPIWQKNIKEIPMASLSSIPCAASSSFPCGGLTAGSLDGSCFWEQVDETSYRPHILPLEARDCTDIQVEPNSCHCLVTYWPAGYHRNDNSSLKQPDPLGVLVVFGANATTPAEFGFNEHHQNEVINYMRFARSKRVLRLKTIDSCFQDLKDSRLVEETFTVDEVTEMLEGLQAVVRGEVETELINTAHTNVLLLRQLFSQAEKFYLKLQTDISELENRELLEQVAEFEKAEFKTTGKKEIARLQEENDRLKARLRTLESQATSALDEKSKVEKALKDLQKIQGDQQLSLQSQEIGSLEDTVAAMKADFQKSLSASEASQKDLQDNLISAKHDLLRVQEQLSLAEKELEKKFQQTAAYRNMKEILTKKNEQIKEIRKRLQNMSGAGGYSLSGGAGLGLGGGVGARMGLGLGSGAGFGAGLGLGGAGMGLGGGSLGLGMGAGASIGLGGGVAASLGMGASAGMGLGGGGVAGLGMGSALGGGGGGSLVASPAFTMGRTIAAGGLTGGSALMAKPPAGPLMAPVLSRAAEKSTLSGLNDRFSSYMAKVQELQQENAALEAKLAQLTGGTDMPPETSSASSHEYESQLNEYRSILETLTMDTVKLEIELDNIRGTASELKAKYDFEQGVKFQLEADITAMRKDIEMASDLQIDLNAKQSSLKNELDFVNKTQMEELSSLQAKLGPSSMDMSVSMIEVDTAKSFDISTALNKIRMEYEKTVQQHREEADAYYKLKMEEIQSASVKSAEALSSTKIEISASKKELQALQLELQSLVAANLTLEQNVAEAQAQSGVAVAEFQAQISSLESAIETAKTELHKQLLAYQELLDIKLALNVEISTYKKILEADDLSTSVQPDSGLTAFYMSNTPLPSSHCKAPPAENPQSSSSSLPSVEFTPEEEPE
ncbi:hypothetical protein JZ751_003752, partial [Albula glossodonta]